MNAEPFAIIERYCPAGSQAHYVLVTHSVLVTRKALEIAAALAERKPDLSIDLGFLEEISLLHDIGIVKVFAPEIGCHGSDPYICHGVRGREILEAEGLPRHAPACERHTGCGMTREEVAEQGLPLPDRDYLPVSIEEKILCVADKLYGKNPGRLWLEKPEEELHQQFERWGPSVVARWRALWSEITGREIAGVENGPAES